MITHAHTWMSWATGWAHTHICSIAISACLPHSFIRSSIDWKIHSTTVKFSNFWQITRLVLRKISVELTIYTAWDEHRKQHAITWHRFGGVYAISISLWTDVKCRSHQSSLVRCTQDGILREQLVTASSIKSQREMAFSVYIQMSRALSNERFTIK